MHSAMQLTDHTAASCQGCAGENPYPVITKELVLEVLKTAEGEDAEFVSWQVEDFTNKGDHFICGVTSIIVTYLQNGSSHIATYVVKFNPCRPDADFNVFTRDMFHKEGNYYTILLPELISCLKEVGVGEIKAPKCHYVSLEHNKEIIVFEDLRSRGFQKHERKTSLDVDHCILILRELAKLHAASVLLQKKYDDQDLLEVFPFLIDAQFGAKSKVRDMCIGLIEPTLESAAKVAEEMEGYEKVAAWIRSVNSKSFDLISEQLIPKKPFAVINHGDFWTNNILFRYDDDGRPVEAIALDFQLIRFASPSCDLSFLFFTSLDSDIRHEYFNDMMSSYFSLFVEAMGNSKNCILFTLDELHKDYLDHSLFGLLIALIILPAVLTEGPDFDSLEDFEAQQRSKILQSPLIRPRYLSLYDEMIDKGVITDPKRPSS